MLIIYEYDFNLFKDTNLTAQGVQLPWCRRYACFNKKQRYSISLRKENARYNLSGNAFLHALLGYVDIPAGNFFTIKSIPAPQLATNVII